MCECAQRVHSVYLGRSLHSLHQPVFTTNFAFYNFWPMCWVSYRAEPRMNWNKTWECCMRRKCVHLSEILDSEMRKSIGRCRNGRWHIHRINNMASNTRGKSSLRFSFDVCLSTGVPFNILWITLSVAVVRLSNERRLHTRVLSTSNRILNLNSQTKFEFLNTAATAVRSLLVLRFATKSHFN